ncbi:MAG: winged helix-turn-helix domain-containing protein [Candidatus Nitrosotenuis sp.]
MKATFQRKSNSPQRKPDRDAQRLLLYVFAGTRGGFTRLQIIHMLQTRPMNTNQIASAMGLDYKAIQHHLEVLEKNNIVGQIGPKYGSMFYLSNYLESNIMALDSVIAILERQTRRRIVYL